MSCAYQCHEVGGPWIAENPDCPVHGAGGVGDQMDEMRSVIQGLIEALEQHGGSAYCEIGLDAEDKALLERARNLL